MPNPFDAVYCLYFIPYLGIFGCFANPRTAFGFKRSSVLQPSLIRGYKIVHSYRSLMLLSSVNLHIEFADLV